MNYNSNKYFNIKNKIADKQGLTIKGKIDNFDGFFQLSCDKYYPFPADLNLQHNQVIFLFPLNLLTILA